MPTFGYYQSCLNNPLPGLEEFAIWFQERCDSQLEVLFGLAFLNIYQYQYHRMVGDAEFCIDARDQCIRLDEPFACSPSGSGASKAFLTCQEKRGPYTWDFGIYTATDNGAYFEESTLTRLLDIDGFGVHRQQRHRDEVKLECEPMGVRFPEERFKDIWQMATAALWFSVWDCRCEETGGNGECSFHNNLQARAIFTMPLDSASPNL